MVSKTKSLRINEDLSNAIDAYLEVTGESFNSFAEEAMAEKMEDILDLKDYQVAVEKDDGTRYSLEQVAKKLDIDL
jgi:predicted DNA-binding protein